MTKQLTDALDDLEYSPENETYRVEYDTAETPPSIAVVLTLDSLEDELDRANPLYETIDPDALDRMLSFDSAKPSTQRSVRFVYCGCRITVSSQGVLEIQPAGDEDGEGP